MIKTEKGQKLDKRERVEAYKERKQRGERRALKRIYC